MSNFINLGPNRKRRQAAESRFQWMGRMAILVSLGVLVLMLVSIGWRTQGAFWVSQIELTVVVPDELERHYEPQVKRALRDRFPDVKKRKDKKQLYQLVSADAGFQVAEAVAANPDLLGKGVTLWVTASDDVDMLMKGHIDRDLPEDSRRVSDQELAWVDHFEETGQIRTVFNWSIFTSGDSQEAELAGILSALIGSFLSLAVCFVLSFPIGVLAAIYLEEFAPKNRLSDLIEVNINNLAAVPSIVFGLLGLAIFLNIWGLPRSTPLVGGMVLALMTLPTIIIASRASLRAVPPSIKEAALGLGASPVQATFQHVAPLALPGMFTGTIVGMAQALGETAPLLMIGMVAFIVDIPQGFTDAATSLPVQIFLWADRPERGFTEKTSAAIVVLLFFLAIMNIAAIILRRKFEKRF